MTITMSASIATRLRISGSPSLFPFGNYFFIITLVFLSSCDSSERENNTRIQQKAESTAVLTYYFKDYLKVASPVIYEVPSNRFTELCIDEINANKDDMKFSKEKILKMSETDTALFPHDLVPFAKLIHKNDLPAYTGMKENRSPSAFENGYYVLATPIFNSKFNYAIVHIGYVCGNRCGHFQYHLFKKTSHKWRLEKSFCKIIM